MYLYVYVCRYIYIYIYIVCTYMYLKQRGPNPNKNSFIRKRCCKRRMEPLIAHVYGSFLIKESSLGLGCS